MVVTGGRDKNIQEILPTEVYDTETSEWRKFSSLGLFRHCCFIKDYNIFVYGGFENKSPNTPISSLYKIESLPLINSSSTLYNKLSTIIQKEGLSFTREIEKINVNGNNTINNNVNNFNNNSNIVNNNNLQINMLSNNSNIGTIGGGKFIQNNNINNKNNNLIQYANINILNKLLEKDINLGFSGLQDNKKESNFMISNEAVVIQATENLDDHISMMRKVDIQKLQNENKRINIEHHRYKVLNKRNYNEEIIEKFIDVLLKPFDWHHTVEMEFIHSKLPFSKDDIEVLLKEVSKILYQEKTLVNVRSPAKIFGNLFGQYYDLMRFFEVYGNPSDVNPMGDININTYIFLGDYCDRGVYSLEVLFLLFALKVKYPDNIILLRGHHEDETVNKKLGLYEECESRLNDITIYSYLNAVFDILPLACVIDNKILCLHGGIGLRLSNLNEILKISKPYSIIHDVKSLDQQIIIDILYSEYSEDILDVSLNEERDIHKLGYISKFGKERLSKFLNENDLSLIITSHSWITEGVKAYNNDKIVLVYSASNYMDKGANIAGILSITKNCKQIIPKLLDTFKHEKKYYKNSKNIMISPIRFKKG